MDTEDLDRTHYELQHKLLGAFIAARDLFEAGYKEYKPIMVQLSKLQNQLDKM